MEDFLKIKRGLLERELTKEELTKREELEREQLERKLNAQFLKLKKTINKTFKKLFLFTILGSLITPCSIWATSSFCRCCWSWRRRGSCWRTSSILWFTILCSLIAFCAFWATTSIIYYIFN